MIKIILIDQTGTIITSSIGPEDQLDDMKNTEYEYKVVPLDTNVSDEYYWDFNSSTIEIRQIVSISADKLNLSAGMTSIINNIPINSWLNINGTNILSTKSTYEINSNDFAEDIRIYLTGKYSSNIIKITNKSLSDFKDNIWQQVKIIRNQKIDAGVTVEDIGRFDTNLNSRTNINAAVTSALIAKSINAPFSITWKLQNNVTVELDADQMISVGTAITNYTTQCHARSEALNTAIYAATSLPELDAIDITQDWP